MADEREETIRTRAHEIWEREGRPEGRHAEHWQQASRELKNAPGSARSTEGNDRQGGLATGLQPGGTIPGGSPGATQGSIGTGGASSGDKPSGSLKRTKGG